MDTYSHTRTLTHTDTHTDTQKQTDRETHTDKLTHSHTHIQKYRADTCIDNHHKVISTDTNTPTLTHRHLVNQLTTKRDGEIDK